MHEGSGRARREEKQELPARLPARRAAGAKVSVRLLEPLALALAAAGDDPDRVFAEFGVAVEGSGSGLHVPLSKAGRVWEHVLAVTGDRCFPLRAAEHVGPCDLASQWAASEKTLRDALPAWIGCLRLHTDAVHWTLEERDRAVLTLHAGPGARDLDPFLEYLLAACHVFLARSGPHDWALRSVTFRHPAPPELERFERLFGVTPRFGAAFYRLEFDAALLTAPMRRPNDAVAGVLRSYADRLRHRVTTADSLDARVGESLRAGTAPGIARLARELGMAPRSLQRALTAEGTSYRAIVTRMRRAEAERLLELRELSICEIAGALGFADVSAFHRAFSRWTGLTPGAFRARHEGT